MQDHSEADSIAEARPVGGSLPNYMDLVLTVFTLG